MKMKRTWLRSPLSCFHTLPHDLEVSFSRFEIFVDCGIESGLDVFKCLATGADAVCVGRELMAALKGGGSAVTERIQEMNRELMAIMARTGAKSLAEIDSSVIRMRTF